MPARRPYNAAPLTHVLAWALFGLTLLLFQPLALRLVLPYQFWVKQLFVFGLWVAVFYLNARVAYPRLLRRQRVAWFVGWLLAATGAVVSLGLLVDRALGVPPLMRQALHAADAANHGARPDSPPGPAGPPPRPDRPGPGPGGGPRGRGELWHFETTTLLATLLVLGISTSITAVQSAQDDARRRQLLEQQQTATELALLRAQINPHFFFNTLNNIYALTMTDAALAGQAVHTLSRLMRYVLYETSGGFARLRQELDFVANYLALMQLRVGRQVTVAFERPESLIDVPVASMLLLPFVENAFKHGLSPTAPSTIRIGVRQPTPATLELDVYNSVFGPAESAAPTPPPSREASNGIGLANTRRRLDLLYPGRYALTITERTAENEFHVHLRILIEEEGA